MGAFAKTSDNGPSVQIFDPDGKPLQTNSVGGLGRSFGRWNSASGKFGRDNWWPWRQVPPIPTINGIWRCREPVPAISTETQPLARGALGSITNSVSGIGLKPSQFGPKRVSSRWNSTQKVPKSDFALDLPASSVPGSRNIGRHWCRPEEIGRRSYWPGSTGVCCITIEDSNNRRRGSANSCVRRTKCSSRRIASATARWISSRPVRQPWQADSFPCARRALRLRRRFESQRIMRHARRHRCNPRPHSGRLWAFKAS